MEASKKQLQVLLIEDSEDDCELIRQALSQGDFDIRLKRVETAETIAHAMEHETWDIVICDHGLPTLDSLTALLIVRETSEDIPFIIVSALISDDVASAAMRNGARDFIRKDNLSRLVPAIERELQEYVLRADFKAMNKSLYHLSHFDGLTGLANRQNLFNHLDWRMSGSTITQPFAIFMIDLNRFRKVNRSLGIPAGNSLLIEVTQRLLMKFGEHYFVARYGADKFVLVASSLHQEDQISTIVDIIHHCLEGAFQINNNELYVSASIGASFYPRDGSNPEYMMEKAESALEVAKKSANRGYQAYNVSIDKDGKSRLAMESELHRALRQDEFVLYYQPQFDISGKKIIGAEALIRWQHPKSGMISPAVFIPILEDSGLIVPVGEWVLRTACAQNKAWQEAGLPPIRIAVNLSSIQFQQPDLVQVIRDALQVTGLHPENLELEITENIAVNNEELVIFALEELRLIGIKIAIDDFGTGYSSLSYLKRFPIDRLKIDQSFVRNRREGTPDDEIVRAIISMGHSLKLKVIAEGVETHEHADFLCSNGCDEVQGYLYGKPMEASDFAALLRSTAIANTPRYPEMA